MNRIKTIMLEDVPAEAVEKLAGLLHGDENLSAFFEDPYLDDLFESVEGDEMDGDEGEAWVTFH